MKKKLKSILFLILIAMVLTMLLFDYLPVSATTNTNDPDIIFNDIILFGEHEYFVDSMTNVLNRKGDDYFESLITDRLVLGIYQTNNSLYASTLDNNNSPVLIEVAYLSGESDVLTLDIAPSELQLRAVPRNELIIYYYLTSTMGLNSAAASGVLANIYAESGFDPHALGDSGTSYGICQWHDTDTDVGRWTNLKNYCNENDCDWTTLEGQLRFMEYELTNSYPGILDYLKSVENSADGAYDAGYYWCYYYEVPANRGTVAVTRGNTAKDTYWIKYSMMDIIKSLFQYIGGIGQIWIYNGLSNAESDMGKASTTTSPIIIDMNDDGVHTTSLSNGIYFDLVENGFKVKTGWVDAVDGLLALDLNGNGRIDNGGELFGNNTKLKNGRLATNGFEALKDLDDNKDNVIDSMDTVWSQLIIWIDENQNGISESEELIHITESDIVSIDLNYETVEFIDAQGNHHRQISAITKSDGSSADIVDVWFSRDFKDSQSIGDIEVTPDIEALPNIRSFGITYSLHQAMMRDASGLLKTLVEQFITESEKEERLQLVEEIIFRWVDVGKRPIDQYKLESLEKLTGEAYTSGTGPNAMAILNNAFDRVARAVYEHLMALTRLVPLYSKIIIEWPDDYDFEYEDIDVSGCSFDLTNIAQFIISVMQDNEIEGKQLLEDFISNIYALALVDKVNLPIFRSILASVDKDYGFIVDYAMKNKMYSLAGGSTVNGTNWDDALLGGGGNDKLYGKDGDDFLHGGKGNDWLEGGAGSNTYLHNLDNGIDTINNNDKTDTPDKLIFGAGINPEDVSVVRNGRNLELVITPIDKVIIYYYFSNAGQTAVVDPNYTIDEITFDDGTVWNGNGLADVMHANGAAILYGTNGDDVLYANQLSPTTIYGGGGSDKLYGGDADDKLYGNTDDNILHGGKGNDTLEGGAGSNTYLYNLGDGVDTINNYDRTDSPDKLIFGEGINPGDVDVVRNGRNLELVLSPLNKVVISYYYSGTAQTAVVDTAYTIDEIIFGDGTVWNGGDLTGAMFANEAATLYGTSGDDILYANKLSPTSIYGGTGNDKLYGGDADDRLYGNSGANILHGGKGTDWLEGGSGVNTYLYNLGDGIDTINNIDRTETPDKLIFGAGINPEDVMVVRNGRNLELVISAISKVIIYYYYSNTSQTASIDPAYTIDEIIFDDGSVWDGNVLTNILFANGAATLYGTIGDDILYGNKVSSTTIYGGGGNDKLYGGDADDKLYGNSGDNILHGGKGNDTLEGGTGSNTYLYNLGDGIDAINNNDKTETPDKLIFGEGIYPEDVKVTRNGRNLELVISAISKVIIYYYYSNTSQTATVDPAYIIDEIIFNDATVWNGANLANIMFANGAATLYGTDGNDVLYGNKLSSTTIYGGGGNDQLYGGDADDKLYGNSGDNILHGGKGNDTLEGGAGSNTYLYYPGDGIDTINNNDKTDTPDKLIFGEGIDPEDVKVTRNGRNMELVISAISKVIIYYYYNNTMQTATVDPAYTIDEIIFSDGTVWNGNNLANIMFANGAATLYGTNGDDILYGNKLNPTTIYGGGGNDQLYGGDADDKLYGSSGDNILHGGKGTDWLEGGTGANTYLYNLGDGIDTINNNDRTDSLDKLIFGEGINPTDVSITRNGRNLELIISPIDKIIIYYYYNSTTQTAAVDPAYAIDEITFADGTVWNGANLTNIMFANGAATLYGTSGDDILFGNNMSSTTIYGGGGNDQLYGGNGADKLYGSSGNNILHGGKGADTLEGGAGSNTYLYNLGDGIDAINNYDKTDTPDKLIFGKGVNPEDVNVIRNGRNLELVISPLDKVILSNYFNNTAQTAAVDPDYFVDEIIFDNGTVWNGKNLTNIMYANGSAALYGTSGDDILYGNKLSSTSIYGGGGNDQLYGGDADDKLYGNSGDNVLHGGKGADSIEGGTGSNTYLYNKGDGIDTINNNDKTDTPDKLIFGEGINPEDVNIVRNGRNLELVLSPIEKVIIYYYFNGTAQTAAVDPVYTIDEIIFADGTVWDGNDLIYASGSTGTVVLNGTGGDDILYADKLTPTTINGGAGNDQLYGGDADDKLYGNSGNNILHGGKGTDWLEGGTGSNTYLYNPGDGIDTINNNDKTDTPDKLIFGDGINPEDVKVTRNGRNMELVISAISKVIIYCYYSNTSQTAAVDSAYTIDEIIFSDGTVWNGANLANIMFANGAATLYGTSGDDVLYANKLSPTTIYGGGGNDKLYGGDADDKLYGSSGDNILHGGKGTDTLEGGTGGNTYLYNSGDGIDTINNYDKTDTPDKLIFGEGINPEDVSVVRNSRNLELVISPIEKVIIYYYFNNTTPTAAVNPDYTIDEIIFNDGAVWDGNNLTKVMYANGAATLYGTVDDDILYGNKLSATTIYGGSGNDKLYGGDADDKLYGSSGDNILHGGKGNDALEGGTGSNTYLYNLGDGIDTINNNDKTDTPDKLIFGEGIDPADVNITRNGRNLELVISAINKVIIAYYYSSTAQTAAVDPAYTIDEIIFDNGTVWDGGNIANIMYANGASILYGTSGDDVLYANKQSPTSIYGGGGNDKLYGGDADDKLYGNSDNNILHGGKGTDWLEGGTGSNIYLYNLGDGVDTINNNDKTDTPDKLIFGEGINPEDVKVTRNGRNLELVISSIEKIIIYYYYNATTQTAAVDPAYTIDEIIFAGGTIWDGANLSNVMYANGAATLYGTGGDDILYGNKLNTTAIYGGAGNDQLYGGDADDKLYGVSGDNVLYGGKGNDTLEGGAGSNTYLYNLGDGIDTINNNDKTDTPDKLIFGEGIKPEDVKVTRNGRNLELVISAIGKVVIYYFYSNTTQTAAVDPAYTIDEIIFDDGTVWNGNSLANIMYANGAATLYGTGGSDILYGNKLSATTIYGGSGNDQLYGGDADDKLYGNSDNNILHGGKGTDSLEGGTGNNTYLYNPGDGIDTINNNDKTDTPDKLIFGEGINPEDVKVTRNGRNLELVMSAINKVIFYCYYSSTSQTADVDPTYTVDEIIFNDGTVWDGNNLTNIMFANGATTLYGTGGDDILYANKQNPTTIYGGGGNDKLYGGDAADKLYGNSGDNILHGGKGNDWLEGGTGSNTYLYNLGDGVDTIKNYDKTNTPDKLIFGEGINPEDVKIVRSGYNLELVISPISKVIINYYFNNTGQNAAVDTDYIIDEIIFSDSTVWYGGNLTNVMYANGAATLYGTAGDDVLYGNQRSSTTINGGGGNDKIYGGEGDDKLYGSSGNNILYGDKGKDWLEGGTGANTYLYNLDDGVDTINNYDKTESPDKLIFGEGIIPEDVEVVRSGRNLELVISPIDKVIINNYYNGTTQTATEDPDYTIDEIHFTTGTDILAYQIVEGELVFLQVLYKLNVLATTGGRIEVDVDETYNEGAMIELSSTAKDGYRFKCWTASKAVAFSDAESAITMFAMPSEDVTITAVFESESEFTRGDIDGDGKITIADAMMVFDYVAGKIQLSNYQKMAAEIDGDGKVTVADAMMLFDYVAGVIPMLE